MCLFTQKHYIPQIQVNKGTLEVDSHFPKSSEQDIMNHEWHGEFPKTTCGPHDLPRREKDKRQLQPQRTAVSTAGSGIMWD